jgi:hypothetical protein
MDNLYKIVTILFILSLISERVANFFKLKLSETRKLLDKTGTIRHFFSFNNTSIRKKDPKEEKDREFRILKINLFFGCAIAIGFHADLFGIIKHIDDANNVLSWNSEYLELKQDCFLTTIGIILLSLLGCFFTGVFLSFGSKFWHDMLDLIMEVKNYRGALATQLEQTDSSSKNTTTGGLDPPVSLNVMNDALRSTKDAIMQIPNVSGVGLSQDNNNYTIRVTARGPVPGIASTYTIMISGNKVTLPVQVIQLPTGSVPQPHTINLGNEVFNINNISDYGTMGVLVRPAGADNNRRYLMTCCHNVVHPITQAPVAPGTITAGSDQLKPLGKVMQNVFNNDADAALVDLAPDIFSQIDNLVPGMGAPQSPVDLLSSDINSKKVYVYGAATRHNLSGTVTDILFDVKIDYEGTPHVLYNLIVVSNNGFAISKNGDSGGCVLDENKNVVGLIVAGITGESYILPINTLLATLSVQLI